MESRSEQKFSLRRSLQRGLGRTKSKVSLGFDSGELLVHFKDHMHFHLRKSAVSTSAHSAESIHSPGPGSETDTGSASPENVSLWDQAYDLLKEEKPEALINKRY
ncbi:WD40 repeat-like protein [Penicillium cf. viridicatum]|uniref:WD40 repeat-like protein n=1 Tax=Penicillium cf. viridicatum TaxID=2972119 RepID=A0A9W9T328_9EURO|nr:WD40 repeat-like protein [Penicillium cf. viridicatum]